GTVSIEVSNARVRMEEKVNAKAVLIPLPSGAPRPSSFEVAAPRVEPDRCEFVMQRIMIERVQQDSLHDNMRGWDIPVLPACPVRIIVEQVAIGVLCYRIARSYWSRRWRAEQCQLGIWDCMDAVGDEWQSRALI